MSNRKLPRGRPSKYPPEFQRDAVAMVLDEGRAIAEVARAIGVNEGTLGNWVAKTRRERSAGVALSSDERSELVVRRGFSEDGLSTLDLGHDLLDGLGPHERLRVVVPVRCPPVDAVSELVST